MAEDAPVCRGRRERPPRGLVRTTRRSRDVPAPDLIRKGPACGEKWGLVVNMLRPLFQLFENMIQTLHEVGLMVGHTGPVESFPQ